MVVRGGMQQKMPPRASSFHKLMACRCLLLYFFWFHTGKVVFGAEFTFCGYLHHSINKSHHHIEPGPGPCSLNVSINQAGLRIKARLIENGPPICTEDIATTTPDGLSDVCITWKGHVGKLFITRGDVVKSYSTAMSTNWKCCQNFILTGSTSSNNSPLLNDIIYINGSHFSPVHIENASYLEFTGSEGACETPWSDCIKQNDKLTQLTTQSTFTLTDARYAVLIVNGILEECNASISVNLGSDLRKVLMNMNFPEDSKTFVTPNVKAAVIKVNQRSNFEFGVTANFSWVLCLPFSAELCCHEACHHLELAVLKPKTSLSLITRISEICPYLESTSSSACSSVSRLRPPMNSFPSSDPFASWPRMSLISYSYDMSLVLAGARKSLTRRTHMALRVPQNNPKIFRNCKGFHSLNVQLVCDHIMAVDACCHIAHDMRHHSWICTSLWESTIACTLAMIGSMVFTELSTIQEADSFTLLTTCDRLSGILPISRNIWEC
uniref:uncharacterized protein n=1 Tax=Pristiophorus japonicus TaxID=55135 RepID=UPI00398F693B